MYMKLKDMEGMWREDVTWKRERNRCSPRPVSGAKSWEGDHHEEGISPRTEIETNDAFKWNWSACKHKQFQYYHQGFTLEKLLKRWEIPRNTGLGWIIPNLSE